MTEAVSEILDEVHSALLKKKYSASTINCYSDWIYRFLFFKNIKNCQQICKKDITDFLTFVKNNNCMAESSKNIAASALIFLSKEILGISFKNTILLHSHFNKEKPHILERDEIKKLLSTISGEKWLIFCIMYGCGVSCSECLSLRVENIDFKTKKIKIHNNNHSRTTLFPKSLHTPLINQINKVSIIFQENINIPKYAGAMKTDETRYTEGQATTEFKEHFLFPSKKLRLNSHSGMLTQYPLSESLVHKSLKDMIKSSGICNNVCCTTFRHSFATHLVEDGYDIHHIQKLMGHKNIQSTMIYKDLANQNAINIRSPLDSLLGTTKPNSD